MSPYRLHATQRPYCKQSKGWGGDPYFHGPKYLSSDTLPAPEIFKFFSKCYPDFFIFYISTKFLHGFLKTIAKFFSAPKFHQKLRNKNSFLYSNISLRFSKISSQLIIIWRYSIISAEPLQKIKFSPNFINIFEQPNQLILKCLSNFLEMFAKLPQGTHLKNMNHRTDSGHLINHRSDLILLIDNPD